MKKIMMIMVLVAVFAVGAVAQPKQLSKEDKEKLFNGKAQMMQKKLGLSEEQTAAFLPLYKSYQEDINKLKRPERVDGKSETLTSDQAYNAVVSQLQFKENILDVQKKYIGKLKSVLTPQQLMQFLRAENDVQMSIRDHKKGRRATLEGHKKFGKMGKKRFGKGKPAADRMKCDSLAKSCAAQDMMPENN